MKLGRTPKIYLLLSGKKDAAKIAVKLEAFLKRRSPNSICIPVKIKGNEIKNVAKCAKILDIKGIIATVK